MGNNDFRDFMNSSKMLHFSRIPYSKVNQLKFGTSNLHHSGYKLSHNHDSFVIENVEIVTPRRKNYANFRKSSILCMEDENALNKVIIIESRKQKNDKVLPSAKKRDLVSMLKYMPLLDRDSYKLMGLKFQNSKFHLSRYYTIPLIEINQLYDTTNWSM